MKINLPTTGFSPYKVYAGIVFVLMFILVPKFMIIVAPIVALLVGKAQVVRDLLGMVGR